MYPIQIVIPIPPGLPEEEKFKQGLNIDKIQLKTNPQKKINDAALERHLSKIIPDHIDDLWELSSLGLKTPPGTNLKSISFRGIKQDWLKSFAKLFIKFYATNAKTSSVNQKAYGILAFSKYLDIHHRFCTSIEYINRDVLLGYSNYLQGLGLSSATISSYLISLRVFLETLKINGWVSFPDPLISGINLPKQKMSIPRYIPEYVLAQLNQNLDRLPPPVMRMVLVVQECGMRGGELSELMLNCLHQDSQGGWFVGFNREKVNAEHRIPTSPELAAVIQEQQAYIKENLPDFEFLFCSRKQGGGFDGETVKFVPTRKKVPTVMLARYLNRLASKCNITDEVGKIWNFHSHQFRHTVGTRMVNNGVPIHIIQRYLGHASPGMTLTYANIHDQTMKTEFLKYHSKVVTVTGQVIQEIQAKDGENELSWLRKNILPQALPNGSCARPVVKGPCPHANACLTCGDFRTTAAFLDKHQAQLDETEKIIESAKSNGWQRQIEMNETVAVNLKAIISSLTQEGQNVGA